MHAPAMEENVRDVQGAPLECPERVPASHGMRRRPSNLPRASSS